MRSTTSLAVLIVAVLIFAGSTAPSSSAAPTDDACSLLTQAQVSDAVGVSVGPGSHVTPTFLKTCTWAPSSGPTKDVKAVTISFQVASAYEGGKRLMEQSAAGANAEKGKDAAHGADIGSISGIGDDAYYLSMGTGYTGLMVKKGNVAIQARHVWRPARRKEEGHRENPGPASLLEAVTRKV